LISATTFGSDCARHLADWQARFEQWFQHGMKSLHPRAGIGPVKPDSSVERFEPLVVRMLRRAVKAGDAGAYGLMPAAMARFGLGTTSALIGHLGGAAPCATP
jgi:hypothetical protein